MHDLTSPTALSFAHDVSVFDCGKTALNDFLRTQAWDTQAAQLARTYVVCHAGKVIAYYTISNVMIWQAGETAHFDHNEHNAIPAILMSRCAVDHRFRKHGVGRGMVLDAIHRVSELMHSGAVPAQVFAVDCIDGAARQFYEKFDMTAFPGDPGRLFLSRGTLDAVHTFA